MKKLAVITFFFALIFAFKACKKDPPEPPKDDPKDSFVYNPTPVTLDMPSNFPEMVIPQDNQLTEEGILLGRLLFYDPILSLDSTLSCAGCHNQSFNFTDSGNKFSTGVQGIEGTRTSMSLANIGFNTHFFWDGRSPTLEDQILKPVPDPIEMNLSWTDAVDRLMNHNYYPQLFREAFDETEITPELTAKAIAQFLRTFISGNSKFDKVQRNEAFFTNAELNGFDMFFSEDADCFHCHGNILFTDNLFHNNALQEASSLNDFNDLGRGAVTGNPLDNGKFKTPTLRNTEVSGPFMHNGEFATLMEVIEFYSSGLKNSPNVDPLMEFFFQGGVQLTQNEKNDLHAFLLTLTDHEFLNNPDFKNPFQDPGFVWDDLTD
ncbi:MAG: cytochrome-c peroxidase [Chitinophagaceae bacterium]|nr:MAG: cytochrome-c peroxidase [Chitinophagaceae bacterium]